MATRQKDKDKEIINFYKKLKKRYPEDATVLSRDHKILEHLVFAIFLENATFEQACSSFNKMERYFIDWNEVRVSKSNEIASVIGNVPNALKVGERLRRLLQWIFDKTFKFDLEETRAKGVEETLGFLKTVPFSTRFMNEYAQLLGFGASVFPMDEGVLRVFRLLGWVVVRDNQEVVPAIDGVFNEKDFPGLFFAAHELGCELMDESTQKSAIKFLATIDPEAAKRSFAPLVESTLPTDPSEIARMYARHKRRPKNVSASAMMNEMFGGESMDSDEIDDSDEFEKDGEDGGYDPYGEGNENEFGANDGFGGRRGVQSSSYEIGKRVETTLSKDGASYFESDSKSNRANGYDQARGAGDGRVVKSRKRVKSVEDSAETSHKTSKASVTRSTKNEVNSDFDPDVAKEKRDSLFGSDGKVSKEKKIPEKKPVESAGASVEKTRSASVDVDDEKKSDSKKSTRATKVRKATEASRVPAKTSVETSEKKKASSDARSVSEKESTGENVKKEKKTTNKTAKEVEVKPKAKSSPLSVAVSRCKSRSKDKEQGGVEDSTVKTKRKRDSESVKGEPPASRSKKG